MASSRPEGDLDSKIRLRFAVLIDADNAQASTIGPILAAVEQRGEASVKRIYGDFTAPQSVSWKSVLQKHAIKPVQNFAYTTGKNATDSALIIDAMDLLYTRKFDGFCLVTSDSDFTGLATRMREDGLIVLVFGAEKTPESFRNACHQFTPIENFHRNAKTKAQPCAAAAPTLALPRLPPDLARNALEQARDQQGWVHLGAFGKSIRNLQPDFDPRHYGHKKLSDLVKANAQLFTCEVRRGPGAAAGSLYIRAK